MLLLGGLQFGFYRYNSCKLAQKIICKVMIAKQFGMHGKAACKSRGGTEQEDEPASRRVDGGDCAIAIT